MDKELREDFDRYMDKILIKENTQKNADQEENEETPIQKLNKMRRRDVNSLIKIKR